MMQFAPFTPAAPWSTITPMQAMEELVTARHGAGAENEAQAVGDSQAAFLLALQDGVVSAVCQRLGDDVMYRIPAAYWHVAWSDMSLGGELFTFPADALVPPALDRAQVLFFRDEFDRFLQKSSRPAAAQGDWWIVHQAIAWLASNDLDYANAMPEDISALTAEGRDGHVLAWVAMTKKAGGPTSVARLKEKLRAACEADKVRAIGIRSSDTDPTVVPAIAFVGADAWHGRELTLHRALAGKSRAAEWSDLRFRAADVLKLTTKKPRRGRTPNSGTFASADAPLVAEMKRLIDQGEARSVNAAAQSVADRAAGPATVESKAKRLRDAYRAVENKSG